MSSASDHHTEKDQVTEFSSGPLASVLKRNIHVLDLRRAAEENEASTEERIAEAITVFTGSMWSVYLHLLAFGFWIVANLGVVPGVEPWDPTFVTLAMFASVEAIFLSTFVLISQNRMAAASQRQADLDLQINLLAEHEITKVVTIVSAIAAKLDVRTEVDREVEELKSDVAPETVLDHIQRAQAQGR